MSGAVGLARPLSAKKWGSPTRGTAPIFFRHPRQSNRALSPCFYRVTAKGRHSRCGDGYCRLKLDLRSPYGFATVKFLPVLGTFCQPYRGASRVSVLYRLFALRTDSRQKPFVAHYSLLIGVGAVKHWCLDGASPRDDHWLRGLSRRTAPHRGHLQSGIGERIGEGE
jgi:hypothetical protein